jgi:hypothetical protein
MTTRRLLIPALFCALLSAGCFEMFNQSNANPNPTVQLLGGTWTSVTANSSSLINSCTNFKWTVTEQSSNSGSGNFTATCFQTLNVSGTARGTLSGATVNWTATAVASGGGINDCAISLTGTATLDGDQIRIPYAGTTCMGPVTGTEVLRRN